ncbi:MAG: prepilin-type N-terminal cleavage/methylation domain-containing protein [Planctomycetes bacterium]|jgi:type II secretion system protein I|nr:prepilin-type N-terminal cleavage/methylation domain-containing protein [Planctomycetota bacterium]
MRIRTDACDALVIPSTAKDLGCEPEQLLFKSPDCSASPQNDRLGAHPSNRAGFTLIEVVAALAIAATALLALLQLQVLSMRTADQARVMTQALLLAQEKMAEVVGRDRLATGVSAGVVEGTDFAWQTQVLDTPLPTACRPAAGRSRLREISVDVTWRTGPGAKHIRLTTYQAEDTIRGV